MPERDRPRRPKKRPKASLFPLFLGLGIVAVLGAAGGVTYVVVKNRAGKDGGKAEKKERPEEPDPKPTLPTVPQVSVLPQVRAKDPLRASATLQAVLAETTRADAGWRLADVEAGRPAYDPDRNGAVRAAGAASLIPKGWAPTDDGAFAFRASRPPTEALPQAEVTAARVALDRMRPALAEARRLADFPDGRYRLEHNADYLSTELPHVQEAIRVVRLLDYDAVVQALDGDGEAAVRDCIAALHVPRYLRGEPMLITYLAGVALHAQILEAAEHALAAKKPASDKTLLALQKLLEDEGARPLLVEAYRGERAGFHYMLTNAANGDAVVPGGALSDADHAWYLRHMNRAVGAAAQPPPARNEAVGALITEAGSAPPQVRARLPDHRKVPLALYRGLARARCAAVAVAAERYRLKEGRWPARLDDLVPGYIAALPTDPYSGRPLRYGVQPEGVSVYCPPGDVVDTGGRFAGLNDEPPANQGFRLVEPQQRR
jgi:hypothetical protein